jgi:hypothetical protein
MTLNKKILIGSAAAIVIFILISLIYFKKGLGGDYVLSQGDVRNFKGAAKEIQDYRAATGEEALWTNSMFGGMPAYQISVMYANKALNFVNRLCQGFLPQPVGMVFLYFAGFFILLLCMKIDPWLAIVGAIAFGFSSYFFVIIEAGHNTKAVAIGYAPPLLGGIILLFRQKWLMGFVLTALFMGLEIYANHPQITYYLFLLVGIYLIVELIGFIREKKIKDYFKAAAIFMAAITIGVLPNVGNLWTTLEYGKYTTRGPSELTISYDGKKNETEKGLPMDYATDWSYGVSESFTLLIPNYKGGASEQIGQRHPELLKDVNPQYYENISQSSLYYGDQPFTSGPVYAGAIIVLLSIAGLFIIRNRIKWVLLIGSVFALALSWGKNFPGLTEFFFDNFPAYNKFRAVSMLLVVVELVLPLLAVLTVQQILDDRKAGTLAVKTKGKLSPAQLGVWISTGVLTLFLLLCLASPTLFNTFHSEQEEVSNYVDNVKKELKKQNPGISAAELNSQVKQYEAGYIGYLAELEKPRISFFRADVGRTLFFVLAGAVLLLLALYTKTSKEIIIGGLGLLVLGDMWAVNWRYLNNESFVPKSADEQFDYRASDDYILKDNSALDFRVVSSAVNTFNNSTVSYYHKSIGGYHGAKLKRFQELREFHLDRELSIASQIADARLPDSVAATYLSRIPVLNMLNTRYIITRNNVDSIPYQNKAANGNAWFVSSVKWAPNADSEIVWTGDINSKTTAVINSRFKEALKGAEGIAARFATIKLTEYKPNYLKYQFESESKQLIVFSEIYYPKGWNAYIDGNKSDYACANYVLRAMMVPAGKHLIEWKFEPQSYFTGEKISFAGVVIYYLAVLGGLAFYIFKWSKKKE